MQKYDRRQFLGRMSAGLAVAGAAAYLPRAGASAASAAVVPGEAGGGKSYDAHGDNIVPLPRDVAEGRLWPIFATPVRGEISIFVGSREVTLHDTVHRRQTGLTLPARGLEHMSSHREAPEISKDPVADSADLYAFVSPDRPDHVTIIANYVPLQGPDGGPNFYEFGDDVLYQIKVDNNGDGIADVTFNFSFRSELGDPEQFPL